MIIEMYSLICQNHSSNQPEPSLCCVWGVGQTVCMFVPVCTVQLCCRLYMRPPFKVSFSDTQSELDHDWDQERREAAKGRYGWKWGSICGTFSFPQKCGKKSGAFTQGQAAASCLKVQRCIQVGAGQKRKTGRCCRIYVEVTEKYVTDPRHSSRVFLDNGRLRGAQSCWGNSADWRNTATCCSLQPQTCRRSFVSIHVSNTAKNQSQ